MISPQTVLPALVTRLGGDSVAVGSLGMIVYVGLFLPQLFAARYLETLPRKKPWTIWFGLVHRLLLFLIAVDLFFMGASHPLAALLIFFFMYGLVQAVMGVTTPGWYDLFAKLTPANRRGRLVGIRNSMGGAGAFLCGIALTWLLDAAAFPVNFGLVICLAFLLQMASLIVQSRLTEPDPSATFSRKPIFTFLRDLPEVLKTNGDFRVFLAAVVLLTLAAMPVGFYTVYALKQFNADESYVGTFTLNVVAIQVVSALVIGFVADRYGNRIALICSGCGLLCASACALLAPSIGWFFPVYSFLGINLGTEIMARYNMSVEYGPATQRSTYVAMMNTVAAPFYLTGIAGGMIVNTWGYAPVFALGVAFAAGAIVVLLRWVKEPRVQPVRAQS